MSSDSSLMVTSVAIVVSFTNTEVRGAHPCAFLCGMSRTYISSRTDCSYPNQKDGDYEDRCKRSERTTRQRRCGGTPPPWRARCGGDLADARERAGGRRGPLRRL